MATKRDTTRHPPLKGCPVCRVSPDTRHADRPVFLPLAKGICVAVETGGWVTRPRGHGPAITTLRFFLRNRSRTALATSRTRDATMVRLLPPGCAMARGNERQPAFEAAATPRSLSEKCSIFRQLPRAGADLSSEIGRPARGATHLFSDSETSVPGPCQFYAAENSPCPLCPFAPVQCLWPIFRRGLANLQIRRMIPAWQTWNRRE